MSEHTIERPRLPLPPRSSADTTGEVRETLATLESLDNRKLILRTLANSDTAFQPFVRFTGRLLRGEHLPRTVQEIVILHMGVRRGTRYEVLEHLVMARDSGVPEEQLDAIVRDGGAVDAELFDDPELLAVRFADEILDSRRVDPALWERVVELWGDAGGLDLILTVATWGALIPTVIESIGLTELGD